MHSLDYWSPEPFAGQRVLAIGFGNTAFDVTLDMSAHTQSINVSIRS